MGGWSGEKVKGYHPHHDCDDRQDHDNDAKDQDHDHNVKDQDHDHNVEDRDRDHDDQNRPGRGEDGVVAQLVARTSRHWRPGVGSVRYDAGDDNLFLSLLSFL